MWGGILLAVVSSGFLLLATPRAAGPLGGWRGVLPGLMTAALATWRLHASGLGLAEATCLMLGVQILALPCLSYLLAARRRSDARALQ